jgi:hypothetical protein
MHTTGGGKLALPASLQLPRKRVALRLRRRPRLSRVLLWQTLLPRQGRASPCLLLLNLLMLRLLQLLPGRRGLLLPVALP